MNEELLKHVLKLTAEMEHMKIRHTEMMSEHDWLYKTVKKLVNATERGPRGYIPDERAQEANAKSDKDPDPNKRNHTRAELLVELKGKHGDSLS